MTEGYTQVAAEDLVKPECKYDQIGLWSPSSGLTWHIVTRVDIRAPRDVHVWAEGWGIAVLDVRELVRIRMNPNKKEETVSEEDKAMSDERYTKEDFEKALKIADIRGGVERTAEFIEVARAQRLGYIRRTTVAKLRTDTDSGKTVRIGAVTRQPKVFTQIVALDAYPSRRFLILDGFMEDFDIETDVWIDDTAIPEETTNG